MTRVTVVEIAHAVMAYRGLEYDNVFVRSRYRKFVWPRQEVAYIARRLRPDFSYPMMGRFLKCDHTTAIHYVQAVDRRMQERDKYAEDFYPLLKWATTTPTLRQDTREILAARSVASGLVALRKRSQSLERARWEWDRTWDRFERVRRFPPCQASAE